MSTANTEMQTAVIIGLLGCSLQLQPRDHSAAEARPRKWTGGYICSGTSVQYFRFVGFLSDILGVRRVWTLMNGLSVRGSYGCVQGTDGRAGHSFSPVDDGLFGIDPEGPDGRSDEQQ